MKLKRGNIIEYCGKKATVIGECSDDRTYLVVFEEGNLGWDWSMMAADVYPEIDLPIGTQGCYWLDKLNPELKKDLKLIK